jgi:hypothetical protein
MSSRPPNQIVAQLWWWSTIASSLNRRDKTYPVATPLPEAPLQPMRATDKGVKATRKPKRALFTIHQSLSRNTCSFYAYTGVGLPKVFSDLRPRHSSATNIASRTAPRQWRLSSTGSCSLPKPESTAAIDIFPHLKFGCEYIGRVEGDANPLQVSWRMFRQYD